MSNLSYTNKFCGNKYRKMNRLILHPLWFSLKSATAFPQEHGVKILDKCSI